jgi:hypothetical protein
MVGQLQEHTTSLHGATLHPERALLFFDIEHMCHFYRAIT